MNKLFGLILLVTISISCNNQHTTEKNNPSINLKQDIIKLNDFLKKYEEPSQTFSVPSSSPAKVKGKSGTIIYVNPEDLVTENGNALGKNIEITLKELANQEHLLRTQLQTVSNGKLLISGGVYYISMISNNNQLKLKDGKSLKVEFPKITEKEMLLFYGEKDALGIINWIPTKDKLRTPIITSGKKVTTYRIEKDTSLVIFDSLLGYIERPLTTKEKMKLKEEIQFNRNIYEAIELKKLG